MQTQPYSSDFFKSIHDGSSASARAVVPLVVGLIRPNSVLDVGCGGGDWLSVFYHDCRIRDVMGVDGYYADAAAWPLPPGTFRHHDLQTPLDLNRRFDLVISLEVAEHIPFEHAETFVESLTRHGDAILFSAAIPGQGGTHHVNEQFPEYWAAVFREKGFSVVDVLRPAIWTNKRVNWWYRQNILLFMNDAVLEKNLDLRRAASEDGELPLTRIHPAMFFRRRYYRRLLLSLGVTRAVFYLIRSEYHEAVERLLG
jgi:SAM-dependent methyltransferase